VHKDVIFLIQDEDRRLAADLVYFIKCRHPALGKLKFRPSTDDAYPLWSGRLLLGVFQFSKHREPRAARSPRDLRCHGLGTHGRGKSVCAHGLTHARGSGIGASLRPLIDHQVGVRRIRPHDPCPGHLDGRGQPARLRGERPQDHPVRRLGDRVAFRRPGIGGAPIAAAREHVHDSGFRVGRVRLLCDPVHGPLHPGRVGAERVGTDFALRSDDARPAV